jgi:phosphate:Na+ symporter
MNFSFFDALTLVGSLGFFIYGMKVMSEGIQKVAGDKMRQILSAMTTNRFFGVFTGFLITIFVQSSSATTVMVVSFVNAGMLSLAQSIGVIMGANIGTTITGWLVSILGFKVSIAKIALPIIGVGFPMLFSKKSRLRALAEFLIGFALLFLGLEALKSSVPDLKSDPEILKFLANYSSLGVMTTLIFIGVGTLLTIIVQSSSAAMALTLVMCFEGWINFEAAAAIILGENIGTTVTANLAAIVANVHAKRAARAHLIFNLIGVFWMFLAFKFVITGIDNYLTSSGGESPLTSASAVPIALSLFHSFFNITNTLLLVWFVPIIEKIVIKMVPSKGEKDEKSHLEYISSGIMSTPELSLLEAKKEVTKFAEIDKRMFSFVKNLLETTDKEEADFIIKKIEKYEGITDIMEEEIADYLLNVAEGDISDTASLTIRSQLSMVTDLERIGDICFQMAKTMENKLDDKTWFTPEQRNNLMAYYILIEEAFELMIENLKSEYNQVGLQSAIDMEKRINEFRDNLRHEHLLSIEKGDYNIKSGMIYSDLYSSCEKIGDHIINVSEAVVGEV